MSDEIYELMKQNLLNIKKISSISITPGQKRKSTIIFPKGYFNFLYGWKNYTIYNKTGPPDLSGSSSGGENIELATIKKIENLIKEAYVKLDHYLYFIFDDLKDNESLDLKKQSEGKRIKKELLESDLEISIRTGLKHNDSSSSKFGESIAIHIHEIDNAKKEINFFFKN